MNITELQAICKEYLDKLYDKSSINCTNNSNWTTKRGEEILNSIFNLDAFLKLENKGFAYWFNIENSIINSELSIVQENGYTFKLIYNISYKPSINYNRMDGGEIVSTCCAIICERVFNDTLELTLTTGVHGIFDLEKDFSSFIKFCCPGPYDVQDELDRWDTKKQTIPDLNNKLLPIIKEKVFEVRS